MTCNKLMVQLKIQSMVYIELVRSLDGFQGVVYKTLIVQIAC